MSGFRILVLCSRIPYPPTDGARLRMFYTARELAREHHVELLVIGEESVDRSAIDSLEETFEAVHLFSYPTYRFYLNTLRGLVSQKPLQTHYYQFNEVAVWLNKHHDRFDLLYCNHVRTTEYTRGYDTPMAVDLVDAISRNYQKAAQDALSLRKVLYQIEWRRLRRYERRVAQEFNHAFIITDSDRRFVAGGGSYQSLSVLPNGVKPQLLSHETTGHRADPTDPRIVFLGKMNYFPNEDAVEEFTTTVFPQVRSEYPGAEFVVVGASPSDRVRALEDHPGVIVTGFVEKPQEYLSEADIVVAPMRHGAGLQNKVLEALALERPVVATPLAKEGIIAADGEHLVVAELGDGFATAITELLADASGRRALGTAARDLIRNEYTWTQIGAELRKYVSDILE